MEEDTLLQRRERIDVLDVGRPAGDLATRSRRSGLAQWHQRQHLGGDPRAVRGMLLGGIWQMGGGGEGLGEVARLGVLNRLRMSAWRPCWRNRSMRVMASSELPPRLKKLSWRPTAVSRADPARGGDERLGVAERWLEVSSARRRRPERGGRPVELAIGGERKCPLGRHRRSGPYGREGGADSRGAITGSTGRRTAPRYRRRDVVAPARPRASSPRPRGWPDGRPASPRSRRLDAQAAYLDLEIIASVELNQPVRRQRPRSPVR